MTDAAPAPLEIPRTGAAASAVALQALLFLAAFWFYMSGPLGPDVSWLMTVAERMLAGQELCVDILEPNPPMAGLLYIPPVLLAQLLRIAPDGLVVAYTLGLALLSTGLSARLVAQSGLLRHTALLWPTAMLLVGIGWGENLAQREHFATIAILPLLVTLALRAAGRSPTRGLWIAAGLCGGVVLAIKPHFALAILLPALFVAVRQRSLRSIFAPEMWVAGAVLAAFTAGTFAVFPGFARNILPVAAATYLPDRRPFDVLLAIPAARGYEALLVLGLIGIRQLWRSAFLGVVFAAALGFALAYLLQGRGYDYQMMPALSLGGLAVFLAFVESGRRDTRGLDTVLAGLAALVLAIVPMAADVALWRVRTPLMEAVGQFGTGLRIGSLGPDLTATSPLHRVVHGELVNAAPALLMSMSAKRLERRGGLDAAQLARIVAVEEGERVRVRQDFLARPPDIIVTTTENYDWLAWAREDAALAEILTGYDDIGTVPFDGYTLRLLKRRGLQPAS